MKFDSYTMNCFEVIGNNVKVLRTRMTGRTDRRTDRQTHGQKYDAKTIHMYELSVDSGTKNFILDMKQCATHPSGSAHDEIR